MDNNHGTKASKEGEEETRKRFRGQSAPTDIELSATTSDEEVEEFFAIIRRMHVASRMMSKTEKSSMEASMSVVGELPKRTGMLDWRPAFKMEDFVEAEEGDSGVEIVKLGHSKDDRAARPKKKAIGLGGAGVCLDLNAEPEPEGVPG